jgi:hypothetical protein
MIELDQTSCRIGTTGMIKGTEMSREDVMGMRVADHRSTRLLATHLDKIIETKAVLSLSTKKPKFPIDFPVSKTPSICPATLQVQTFKFLQIRLQD